MLLVLYMEAKIEILSDAEYKI